MLISRLNPGVLTTRMETKNDLINAHVNQDIHLCQSYYYVVDALIIRAWPFAIALLTCIGEVTFGRLMRY